MGVIDDIDHRREARERDRENSARLAHSYAVYDTVGTGVIHHNKRIRFAVAYVERPVSQYGCEIDVDDLADQLDVAERSDVILPMTSGYVTDWDQDDRDFYTGCWVAVRVDFAMSLSFLPPPKADGSPTDYTTAKPAVSHHFTFSAVGLKDVPIDATDAVE